jgi:hypothetical protein
MTKEKNNLLILWTLRGLIKNLNKINIIDPSQKKDDLYVLYAKGLIKNGLVDSAELVWIDPNLEKQRFEIEKNIIVLVFSSPQQAQKKPVCHRKTHDASTQSRPNKTNHNSGRTDEQRNRDPKTICDLAHVDSTHTKTNHQIIE